MHSVVMILKKFEAHVGAGAPAPDHAQGGQRSGVRGVRAAGRPGDRHPRHERVRPHLRQQQLHRGAQQRPAPHGSPSRLLRRGHGRVAARRHPCLQPASAPGQVSPRESSRSQVPGLSALTYQCNSQMPSFRRNGAVFPLLLREQQEAANTVLHLA